VAGLYFHIPFRTASRSYDDAYYEVFPDEQDRTSSLASFTEAVDAELRLYARDYAEDEPIQTIYAGGGRPSLLPLRHVRSLLNTVLDVFDASMFEESTAEVNPADATRTYLSGLRNVGFDRLSVEALSFYPEDLQRLGAPHRASDVIRTIRTAVNVGFDSLAVDLAFGWPDQSMQQWEKNLQQAVEMGIPSVTLMEHRADGPGDTDDDRMQRARKLQRAGDMLTDAGYHPYEVTHYARPGHESVHLKNTYAHGSYIGVGPSAESFWWPQRAGNRSASRWTNIRDLSRYVEVLGNRYPPIAYRQTADWTSLAREFIFLRMRTQEGLSLPDLHKRYGYDLLAEKGDLVDRLIDNSLMNGLGDQCLRLTRSGRLVADGIAEKLMPE